MKKKLIIALVTALVFTTTLPMTAFAVEKDLLIAQNPAATNSATGEALAPISLSLDQAIEALNESPQMEIIKLQKMYNQAVASGAAEALSTLDDAKKGLNAFLSTPAASALSDPSDPTSSTLGEIYTSSYESLRASVPKNDLERTKSFARAMIEPNDQARKNALKLDAISTYYLLKNTEALYKNALENYEISQTIYANTQKKYNVGVASKVDLLTAELNLNETKDGFIAAENGLAQVKMGFNLFFGFELMQPVTLTSDIAIPELPTMTLEDSIKSALENRNELKEAKYAFEVAEKTYKSKSAYPSSSSTHMTAKAGYIAAKSAYDTKPALIEQDVRTKYMTMLQQHEALKTSEKSLANAKETLRLAQLQYDNGIITLTTVQQAQLGYSAALQSHAEAILDYALAVENYNLCSGVGTEAASLS